jgi:hypothetical protein
MTSFGRHEMEALLAPQEPPCISVFLPTPRPSASSDGEGVRLRNLLRQAEERLPEGPQRATLIEPLVDAARADDERRLARGPARGLALFRSAALFARHWLPVTVPEKVVVADTFHVRPLLRFLQDDQRYYVLALSQHHVALYEGTAYSLEPVEVAGLPASLDEAGLGPREGPVFLQLRRAGRGRTTFHGHGGPETAHKGDLPRFFRAVDRALWPRLRGERAPLILAGVAAHWPVYRAVSRYPHVAAVGIEGNAADLGAGELRERAAGHAREIVHARDERVLRDFARARRKGLGAVGVEAVAAHAARGRVRLLLLPGGVPVWGSLDVVSGRVTRSDGPVENKDDVLDDVAELVLRRGGDVLAVPAERMPDGSEAAALLRW